MTAAERNSVWFADAVNGKAVFRRSPFITVYPKPWAAARFMGLRWITIYINRRAWRNEKNEPEWRCALRIELSWKNFPRISLRFGGLA